MTGLSECDTRHVIRGLPLPDGPDPVPQRVQGGHSRGPGHLVAAVKHRIHGAVPGQTQPQAQTRLHPQLCGSAARGGGPATHHARDYGRERSLHAAHRPADQPPREARQALPITGNTILEK